jgi:hypothetical protein
MTERSEEIKKAPQARSFVESANVVCEATR